MAPFRTLVIRVTKEEFDWIENKAKKLGFSPSAYAKYQTLEGCPLAYTVSATVQQLTKKMEAEIKRKPSGSTFIVSSLVDQAEWWALDRREKSLLSHWLAKYVKQNPALYETNGQTPNKTTIYKKK